MADILIDKQAKTLDISDAYAGYSQVIIKTGEVDSEGNDLVYIAGDTTGRTLEIENPWGSQELADSILQKVQGWVYQPMDASSVKLPPAFEIGDSVSINGVYSGIYDAEVRFSHVFAGDVKAPSDKEIDHEYSFEDSRERKYTRKINDAVARLNFYVDRIEAKVDKNGGNETFGWNLTEDSWSVFNQNGAIFYVNENGAYVKGEIQADTGTIAGFNIKENAIYKDMTSFNDTEHNGVYIGIDGISLGKGNFSVDAFGNVHAVNGYFDGNVYAENIQWGDGTGGYLSSGAIDLDGMLSVGSMVQDIVNSLDYADFSWDVFSNQRVANYCYATYLLAQRDVTAPTYYIDYGQGQRGSVNTHTHYVEVDNNTGKVILGVPDFMGRSHPFNIADTVFYQDAVSAARIQGAESVRLTKLYVNAAGEPYDYNNKKYADVLVEYTLSSANGYGTPYINEITKAIDVTAVWEAAGGGQSEVSVSSIYSTRFASNYQTVYVRAMLSDGSISNEFAIDISTAWNNGYETGWNNVDVSWSDGDYDIWIHPYYYDSWEEVCGGLLHAKLTNGKEKERRLDHWDN